MQQATVSVDEGTYFSRLWEQLRSVKGARPRPADLPKVPAALKLYQVTAWITGVMLLLLCAEMVVKYGFGHWVYAFQPGQPIVSFPIVNPATDPYLQGVNLSIGVLIAHGWLYVLYLFADFRLWSLMRMPFTKFVQIALGGVIPFMSFIVEGIITKQVRGYLAENASAEPRTSAADRHVTAGGQD
jgi:integral membrane protein